MINKLLASIKESYECNSVDVGDFKDVKVEGAKIHIEAYDVSGLGRVSTVEVVGFLKLWKMQSMIINPLEKDAPIYYYHRHNRKGNDIYKVEVLNSLLEDRALNEFAPVLEKYASIKDLQDKENWYDEIKMPGCVLKSVKKAECAKLDEVAMEHFSAYLKLVDAAPKCGKTRKKGAAQEFVDGLVEWSGIAVLQLFRAYYDKHVAKALCVDVLFGMK